MTLILTDNEIADLIQEDKPLLKQPIIQIKEKRGHKEQKIKIEGGNGNRFVLILRQSLFNQLDFSAILGYFIPQTNNKILLKRYNGKSHEHSNPLEKTEKFYDFHIHQATERYQLAGFRAEHYALATKRYGNLNQAIECLYDDCNIQFKGKNQKTLLMWG